MKRKRAAVLCCFAVFVLCLAVLVFIAFRAAYSVPVIGGAGMPTFVLEFRKLLRSPSGSIIGGVGILSLAAAAVLIVKY